MGRGSQRPCQCIALRSHIPPNRLYLHRGEALNRGEALSRLIAERVGGTGPAIPLPEAWLRCPITAGGLGLHQPALLAAAYAESYAKRTPPPVLVERAAGWQRRANDWSRFTMSLLPEVKPAVPEPYKVMETEMDDFTSRGSQLSGGVQQGSHLIGAVCSPPTARRSWNDSARPASSLPSLCRSSSSLNASLVTPASARCRWADTNIHLLHRGEGRSCLSPDTAP